MAQIKVSVRTCNSSATVTQLVVIPDEELEGYIPHDREEVIKDYAKRAAQDLIEVSWVEVSAAQNGEPLPMRQTSGVKNTLP